MPSNVTGSSLRGLLVPDPRLSYANFANESTLTQAGPLPGIPEAQADSDMVLEATGSQGPDGQLRIRAIKAGQPGPDGGGFAWRNAGDPLWRGWDPPHAVSFFEYYDFTTTANKWEHPHAITLSDGTIVVVVTKARRYVVCLQRDPVSGSWSETTIQDNGAVFAFSARPTVVALPSGRLVCFFWQEYATNNENQVRMEYSDDQGASWSLGNKACLTTALDTATYEPKRLRAAYLNGQIVMVAWVVNPALARHDILIQYASSDLGGSFVAVDTWEGVDGSSWASYPSLVVANHQLLLHYVTNDTALARVVPKQRRIANAFSLFSSADEELACQDTNPMTWGTFAAFEFSAGDLSSWVDEDGVLYMAGRDHDVGGGSLHECYVQRSTDGGTTWAMVGSSAANGFGAPWWNGQDALVFPRDFCGVAQGGRSVLLHELTTNNAANIDDSLAVTYLGGYSTVTLPTLNKFPSAAERVAWERTWLPFDDPATLGGIFTVVTAGAPVVTLTGDGEQITGGGGDGETYYANPASTLVQGMLGFLDIVVATGTGILDVRSGVAGPTSYSVRITVTTTEIKLRDLGGGVDIATVATTEGTTGVQLLLAVGNDSGAPANNGQCSAWYRPTGSGTDREWIALGSSSALVNSATATNNYQAGCAAGAAVDVTLRMMAYSYGTYAGQNIYAGQSNPSELGPRSFSAFPLFVDDGVKLNAVDGPCFYGDEWDVDTRYEYGIENVFAEVSPSPRRGWRSTTDASDVEIVLEYDPVLNQMTPPLSAMLGSGLFEINFRTFELWGWDKGLAMWVKVFDGDAATGQSDLKFVRDADVVAPRLASTTQAAEWFTYHTLANSHFQMFLGGQDGYNQVRKIRTNAEGAWSNVNTKHTRVALLDVQAADSAGGVLPLGSIWSKDVVVLANNVVEFTKYKLTIPAQDTAEGYFTIGTWVLGHVVTFARQYSWGRALGNEPNYALTTGRSGTRRARALGPMRRSVELSWTDGVDVGQATKANGTADYVLGAVNATEPLGSPHDTPYVVAGVAEALAGAVSPVVYLPGFDVPADVATAVHVVNRNRMLYSRLVSNPRLESRLGNEWGGIHGELFNVATITLEEEV